MTEGRRRPFFQHNHTTEIISQHVCVSPWRRNNATNTLIGRRTPWMTRSRCFGRTSRGSTRHYVWRRASQRCSRGRARGFASLAASCGPHPRRGARLAAAVPRGEAAEHAFQTGTARATSCNCCSTSSGCAARCGPTCTHAPHFRARTRHALLRTGHSALCCPIPVPAACQHRHTLHALREAKGRGTCRLWTITCHCAGQSG